MKQKGKQMLPCIIDSENIEQDLRTTPYYLESFKNHFNFNFDFILNRSSLNKYQLAVFNGA